MSKTLFEQATNPVQYDEGEVVWQNEGDENNPIRKLLLEGLAEHLANVAGKKVLDVGCGTGWLCNEVAQRGGQTLGIDSSAKNIRMAQIAYPELRFAKLGLHEFEVDERYDMVTASMVFEHMPNAEMAFSKVRSLLTFGGNMLLISGDFDKFTKPRFGYTLQIEAIQEGEVATRTDYGERMGVLYDIFRTTKRTIQAAENAGLELVSNQPIIPSAQLMSQSPKYAEFQGEPLFNLYTFKF